MMTFVAGLRQNKITFEGFMSSIRIFIENSKFFLPWAILRRFDYDDELNLNLPAELEWNEENRRGGEFTALSSDATNFLEKIYLHSGKISSHN